jgi:hypothetical protein
VFQLSSDKIARQRVQRLETIAKRADAVLELLDEGLIGGWARQEIAMTFPLKEGVVRKTAEFRTDHGQPDAAPSFNGFLAGLQRLSAAARWRIRQYRVPSMGECEDQNCEAKQSREQDYLPEPDFTGQHNEADRPGSRRHRSSRQWQIQRLGEFVSSSL